MKSFTVLKPGDLLWVTRVKQGALDEYTQKKRDIERIKGEVAALQEDVQLRWPDDHKPDEDWLFWGRA